MASFRREITRTAVAEIIVAFQSTPEGCSGRLWHLLGRFLEFLSERHHLLLCQQEASSAGRALNHQYQEGGVCLAYKYAKIGDKKLCEARAEWLSSDRLWLRS